MIASNHLPYLSDILDEPEKVGRKKVGVYLATIAHLSHLHPDYVVYGRGIAGEGWAGDMPDNDGEVEQEEEEEEVEPGEHDGRAIGWEAVRSASPSSSSGSESDDEASTSAPRDVLNPDAFKSNAVEDIGNKPPNDGRKDGQLPEQPKKRGIFGMFKKSKKRAATM